MLMPKMLSGISKNGKTLQLDADFGSGCRPRHQE